MQGVSVQIARAWSTLSAALHVAGASATSPNEDIPAWLALRRTVSQVRGEIPNLRRRASSASERETLDLLDFTTIQVEGVVLLACTGQLDERAANDAIRATMAAMEALINAGPPDRA